MRGGGEEEEGQTRKQRTIHFYCLCLEIYVQCTCTYIHVHVHVHVYFAHILPFLCPIISFTFRACQDRTFFVVGISLLQLNIVALYTAMCRYGLTRVPLSLSACAI